MIQPQTITILAIGSTEDLYPYGALALGLQQVEYSVKVATNSNFEAFVRNLGLDFAAIAGDFQALLQSEIGLEMLQGKAVKLIEDDLLKQQMNDVLNAAQGTEVFIFNHLAIRGYHVAEQLEVPSFFASTVSLSATRQFPFLRFSDNANPNILTGCLNYASYIGIELD